MTNDLVAYEFGDRVARITMDDGRVNVFSVPMLRSLHAAFDRAEDDGALVVLAGRPDRFSAGFDLGAFSRGGDEITEMLVLGATLAERVLSFPTPVVAVCTGHAYPAGAFLLLAADVRLGVGGPYLIGLNEVRIGLTVPWFAIELARHRLSPAAFDRAVVTGTMCTPHEALAAGFLDAVVDDADLPAATEEAVSTLSELDPVAHAATKLRVRGQVIEAVHRAIEAELRPSGG